MATPSPAVLLIKEQLLTVKTFGAETAPQIFAVLLIKEQLLTVKSLSA